MVVRRCSDANRFACSDLGSCRVSDLLDVGSGGSGVDDFLVFDGTTWTPQPLGLPARLNAADLTDVGDVSDAVAPQVGHVLQWNGTQWVPGIVLAGTGTFVPAQLASAVLNDLGDVTTAAATTGQVLAKQASGQWQGVTVTPGVGAVQIVRANYRLPAPVSRTVGPGQGRFTHAGPYTVTLNNPNPTTPMTVLRSCSASGYLTATGAGDHGGMFVWQEAGTGIAGVREEGWFSCNRGSAPWASSAGGAVMPHDAVVPGGGSYSVTLNLIWGPAGQPPTFSNTDVVLLDLNVRLVGLVG